MIINKIYLASSWRNVYYPQVLKLLKECGYDVYDFRNPHAHFKWSDIDPEWENWDTDQYKRALNNSLAVKGFNNDMFMLTNCDLCIMVLPCGRSANLELGIAIGKGIPTIIYIPEKIEPELMYKAANFIVSSEKELLVRIGWLQT
jgi:nucleoside 2-deoxyribosyltransferase